MQVTMVTLGYVYWWCLRGAWTLLFFTLQAMVWQTLASTPKVMTHTTEVPCRSPSEYNLCYDCKTNSGQEEDFCSDPFNASHPLAGTVQCDKDQFCTKWVAKLQSGAVQTQRTCSSKLLLELKIYTVCMTESGSDEGHLCFCDGELCNAATSLAPVTSWVYAVIVVSVLAHFHVRGIIDVLAS